MDNIAREPHLLYPIHPLPHKRRDVRRAHEGLSDAFNAVVPVSLVEPVVFFSIILGMESFADFILVEAETNGYDKLFSQEKKRIEQTRQWSWWNTSNSMTW